MGRIKLVTGEPARLKKGLDNLMRSDDGLELPQDQTAQLQTGSLESSNVNMVDAMVQMIEQARAYEVQVQLVSSVRDMDVNSTRSEEHTSELQSLMRISYAVFCLKKIQQQRKNTIKKIQTNTTTIRTDRQCTETKTTNKDT